MQFSTKTRVTVTTQKIHGLTIEPVDNIPRCRKSRYWIDSRHRIRHTFFFHINNPSLLVDAKLVNSRYHPPPPHPLTPNIKYPNSNTGRSIRIILCFRNDLRWRAQKHALPKTDCGPGQTPQQVAGIIHTVTAASSINLVLPQ